MSVLVSKLRAVLFSNLRPDMPVKIRKAAWDLFNAVDGDLDIINYTDNESSTTQESMEAFDAALSGSETGDFEPLPTITEEDDVPSNPILAISDDELE